MDPVGLGLAFRALRRRRGWTQVRLAKAAGCSRTSVSRVERGGSDDVTLRALLGLAAALDARLIVRLLFRGAELDRLMDAAHARLVEAVVRRLVAAGWTVATEVTYAVFGERGSIDVLAFHAATGALLVIEVRSVVPDLQSMLSRLDQKVRLAAGIARARGWTPASVSRVLVLPDERTVRRRVGDHRATFDAALPARTREVRRWLREPAPVLAGILFLTDDQSTVARQTAATRASAV